MRRALDGSYWLPRRNKQLEKELDLKYDRVPNELKWNPKAHYQDLELFRDALKDRVVSIIGKGPSLDNLKIADMENDFVFAINESIRKVESLIHYSYCCITQDYNLTTTCRPKKEGIPLIINKRIQAWYYDYPSLYTFDNKDLGIPENSLTASVAISIAKKFGVKKIRMLCFDALVNKNLNYAKVVGHPPTGDPRRFLEHRSELDQRLSGLLVDWVLPA